MNEKKQKNSFRRIYGNFNYGNVVSRNSQYQQSVLIVKESTLNKTMLLLVF